MGLIRTYRNYLLPTAFMGFYYLLPSLVEGLLLDFHPIATLSDGTPHR